MSSIPEKKHRRFSSSWFVTMVVIAAISLSSCASLDQLIQKPTIAFNGLEMTNASLLDGTFNFHFIITNPNPINIHAGRILYDLKFNGTNFVKGRLENGITLPGRSAATLTVPVNVHYLDVFDSMMEMMRRKTAAYDLSGSFKVGPMTIPFQTRGTFDLPQMPKIYMESIRIGNLSFLGARLNCRLGIENPNAFGMLIRHMDYDLKLDGIPFAKATAQPQEAIPGKGKSILDVAFDVSFAQLGQTAYRILTGSAADYKLEGRMNMDPKNTNSRPLPFNIGGRVPFLR
jgi:LEA14-like dessication related protein